MDDYQKDLIAIKTIECLSGQRGRTVNELLSYLEYTKDFLLNRIVIKDVNVQALYEEYLKHKKSSKPGC